MHDCPHIGCPIQIPWGSFACATHWNQLPDTIREAADEARRHFIGGLDEDRIEQRAVIAAARDHWSTT